MRKTIKVTETELTKMISRIIKESHTFDDDRMNVPNYEPDENSDRRTDLKLKNIEKKVLGLIDLYVSMTTGSGSRFNPNVIIKMVNNQFSKSIERHSDNEPDWV